MKDDATTTRERNEARMRQVEQSLAKVGPNNRAFSRDLITRRLVSRKAKPKTLIENARILRLADEELKDKAFHLVTPEEWLGLVAGWSSRLEHTTLAQYVNFMRLALKDLLGVDKLPKPIDKALYVHPCKERIVGRLVSDDDFCKLLLAAGGLGKDMGTFPTTEKSQALLWVSRDSGSGQRKS